MLWLTSAIKHIFSQTKPNNFINYKDKKERNKLEEIYLEMISSFISDAEAIISSAKKTVVSSNDSVTRQILGLEYPKDGDSVFEQKYSIDLCKPILVAATEVFQKSPSLKKIYPVTETYLSYRDCIPYLDKFPFIIKMFKLILQVFNNRYTETEGETLKISFLETMRPDDLYSKEMKEPWNVFKKELKSFLLLWNDIWQVTQQFEGFLDNISLPKEYTDHVISLGSTINYLLPSRHGPGRCSWYMLNTLAILHNMFTSKDSSPCDLILLESSVFYSHSSTSLLWGFYECLDNSESPSNSINSSSKYHFDKVEAMLKKELRLSFVCAIEMTSLKQLLFIPLKGPSNWFIYFKNVSFCSLSFKTQTLNYHV